MIDKLTAWFTALTSREQILVGIAAVLSAAVIGVFLVAMPLFSAITDAQQQYRTALERRTSIEAKVDRISLAKGKEQKSPKISDIRSLIDISAGEAGFTLDQMDDRGGGVVDIAVSAANPRALMQWLLALEARGVEVSDVDIQTAQNSSVGFSATMAAAGSGQ